MAEGDIPFGHVYAAGDIKSHTKNGLSAAPKRDAHRHLPMIQGGFGNVLVMLLME